MNQTFAVALNEPAAQRDFQVSEGDDFTVTLTAYATDDPEDVNPVDLTGATLTLHLGCYSWTRNRIEGTGDDPVVFTFTDVFSSRRRYFGYRTPFRITMTVGGRNSTIAYGQISMHGNDCCGYGWGFYDYGWYWPL